MLGSRGPVSSWLEMELRRSGVEWGRRVEVAVVCVVLGVEVDAGRKTDGSDWVLLRRKSGMVEVVVGGGKTW